jgi:hypothetical protein
MSDNLDIGHPHIETQVTIILYFSAYCDTDIELYTRSCKCAATWKMLRKS